MEVGRMTYRELVEINKISQVFKAIDIDEKIKLAGDKKGYKDLDKVLNQYRNEAVASVNTNEATLENVALLNFIKNKTGEIDVT